MKIFKKVANVFIWILIVVISIIAIFGSVFMIGKAVNKNFTLFGYAYQVGLNYSMKPTLMPNDFLVTHREKEYKLNDIVTFNGNEKGKLITHRIIEVTEYGYITKGDNPVVGQDAEITNDDIIGKVVFKISFIGGILRVSQNPFGIVLLFAIIVVCGYIIRILKEK